MNRFENNKEEKMSKLIRLVKTISDDVEKNNLNRVLVISRSRREANFCRFLLNSASPKLKWSELNKNVIPDLMVISRRDFYKFVKTQNCSSYPVIWILE